jgi:phenylpyruvate tautomerase PptA (4-oxalocrotonate tautomerase family)
MIDLTYPEGAIAPVARDALAEELTAALLRAERAPDTEFFRSITWLFVHELPATHVRAGGRPAVEPVVRVEATTPEGALSDRRRAEFVERATAAVREATGMREEDALRIWVVCREVPEGSWGAAGRVVEFKALREAAAAERAKDAATA